MPSVWFHQLPSSGVPTSNIETACKPSDILFAVFTYQKDERKRSDVRSNVKSSLHPSPTTQHPTCDSNSNSWAYAMGGWPPCVDRLRSESLSCSSDSKYLHTKPSWLVKMTGLDYKKDRLLEIAVLITDGNLDIVEPVGLSYIIKTEKLILDTMHPWCIKQHGEVRFPELLFL